ASEMFKSACINFARLTTKQTKNTWNFCDVLSVALRLQLSSLMPDFALLFCVRRGWFLLVTCWLWAGCHHVRSSAPDFPAERERMVKEQIVMRGVVEQRVLAAMRKVPREEFVPAEVRAQSYSDGPLPIGYD